MQGPIPESMPTSTLACPPPQALLDEFGSIGVTVKPHELATGRNSGVAVPSTPAFQTKQ